MRVEAVHCQGIIQNGDRIMMAFLAAVVLWLHIQCLLCISSRYIGSAYAIYAGAHCTGGRGKHTFWRRNPIHRQKHKSLLTNVRE